MDTKIKIVYLEGNLGVGKSTLLDNLKRELESDRVYSNIINFIFLQEPVDLWRKSGGLELLYNKKIKSSLFQMMVLATRSTSLFSITSQLKRNKWNIIITERSLKFGDRAFSNLYISDQNELNLYNNCAHAIGESFDDTLKTLDPNFGEVYIYLNLDTDECLTRINTRKRPEEHKLSLHLLNNIEDSHKKLMNTIHPLVHINANRNQAEIVDDICNTVIKESLAHFESNCE